MASADTQPRGINRGRALTREMLAATEARFLAKAHVGEPDACWPWKSGERDHGHPKFHVGGRADGFFVVASRVSYALFVGDVPAEACVCHRCDNPRCINPAHLFVGTQGDNMRDMYSKNRSWVTTSPETHARGERHASAKLTQANVLEIRCRLSKGESLGQIGKRYGVLKSTVARIRDRVTWAHV